MVSAYVGILPLGLRRLCHILLYRGLSFGHTTIVMSSKIIVWVAEVEQ